MSTVKTKILNTVVVGSGLASLSFLDAYLSKKQSVDVISPNFSKDLDKKDNKNNHSIKFLPTQMDKSFIKAKNYYYSNNLHVSNNCKILGSLEFGGLSNYWGLQIDSEIDKDISHLKKETINKIKICFFEFLKKNSLIGKISSGKNFSYHNDYEISQNLSSIEDFKDNNYFINKPILGFSKKKNKSKNKIKFSDFNEEQSKLTSNIFFKNNLKNKNIKFHNYYVEKICRDKNRIVLFCRNEKKHLKKFIAKKVILGSGTIASTRLIMDFLKISREVAIRHHPRLITVFFSRKRIKSSLNFTPSLIQIKNKFSKNSYSADIRPGNRLITNSIMELKWFLYPFKFIINLLKDYLIFSNILLDSDLSNLYMRRDKKTSKFKVYSKNKSTLNDLKIKQNKIFKFLLSKKKIFPIYKNFFPGIGADYHYFGTLPMAEKKKDRMFVNEDCQLNSCKNIYIIDGSVLNFKRNKYPLGLIIANARRVGKKLSK